MAQSTIKTILTEMERGIEEEIQNKLPDREPGPAKLTLSAIGAPSPDMPDYVEHRDGATEIGKLSAEAVVREYEAAAKEIEAVGAELTERVEQCQTMTRDAFRMTEELKEIAARYREEAKRVFLQIESCSLMTAEVRKTCAELSEKISASAATATDKSKLKKK
jgi:hypothetical protein